MASAPAASKLPHLADLDDPTFDPFASEIFSYGEVLDIWSRIDALRRDGNVHRGDFHSLFMDTPYAALPNREPRFIILGYENVFNVLTHPETFRNAVFKNTTGLSFGRSIHVMDAPEHQHYRRIFQKAFLPQVVSQWGESVVAPVVDSLVGKFESRGSAELVSEFTLHYPFQIVYRQLGLDPEQIPVFQKLAWTQTLFRSDVDKVIEASQKLGVFFSALIEQRLDDPRDDLVSHLAHTEVEGERLPEDVLVSFCRQLVNAGGDTTYRGTSCLLAALLMHPEQLDAVRADRTLIPQAIEEGLRWEGPIMTLLRNVEHDAAIDGVHIPAGSIVDAVVGSANHDPAAYADPHQFDIFRARTSRPIPFGSGPHVCIGQHLARIEMTRALNALLDRLPNLRLNPGYARPEIRGYQFRKPDHLHVLFG